MKLLKYASLLLVFLGMTGFISNSALGGTSPYCDTEVQHLGLPAETASAVLLTITNVDATSMLVSVESADADVVDDLIIANGSGAAISGLDTSVPGVISRTLSWGSAPTDVMLNVLWSKASFAGNWQLSPSEITVAFIDNCDGVAPEVALADLQVDGSTVAGFDASTLDYSVELPFGTSTVPTVTATAADAGANVVITPAVGIPGTTTVDVTSADGLTTANYTVVFTEGADPSVSLYCEELSYHLGIPAEVPSAALVTITKLSPTSMFVEVESADADPVDVLVIANGSGAAISPEDTSVPGKISRTLTWVAPPATVDLNVLWSKVSFVGNWQLSPTELSIPFEATCPGFEIGPGGPLTLTLDVSCTASPTPAEVRMTGAFWGWDPAGGPVASDNGDGTWSVVLDPAPTASMEYLWVVDGTQENLIQDMVDGGSCAPVTDFFSYANRIWNVGEPDVEDTFDQCISCNPVSGPVSLTVDVSCSANPTPAEVRMTGAFWGWDPVGGPVATDNGDGTWTVVLDPAPTANMEYLWLIDGVQENLIQAMVDGGSCAPVTDFFSYANRLWNVGDPDVSDTYGQCDACTPVTSGVTLTLDVSCSTNPTPTEVRMTGNFWGFDPVGGPVAVDNGDGTWTVTLDPEPTADMEYLWLIDGVQENLIDNMQAGGACAPITDFSSYANRLWQPGDGDRNDSYDSCFACNPNGAPVSLTVEVCDGTPGEVRLTGPFWGFDPLGGPVATANGDGTYTVTLDPQPTESMSYLWVVDGVLEGLVGAGSCAPFTDGVNFANRVWQVGDDNVTDDVYNSCSACPPPSASVQLTLDANCTGLTPTEVRMTGAFWGWDPAGGPIAADNGDGTWTVTLDPAPTANMEYLWIIDGAQENLIDDMQAGGACAPVTDFFSYANRLWVVGDGDRFDTYDSCTACETPTAPVSLTVDVACANTSISEVRLTGAFWGFDPLGGPVATDNGDGTWTVTLDPQPAASMAYLWVIDGVTESLVGAGDCAPFTDGVNFANRVWHVGDGNANDIWNSCDACTPSPVSLTVEICGGTPGEVRMTGAFWGWDPFGGPVATDNGDGTYTVVLDPAPSANMEYLWVVDGVQENLIQDMVDGGTCAPVTDFFSYANRIWIVGEPDVSDVYDQCTACPEPVEGCTNPEAINYDPAANVDNGSCQHLVTFRVDMANVTIDPEDVHIAGDFQGFNPSSTLMVPLVYNVYQYSIALTENTTYEYKFVNGNTEAGYEIVPVECATNSNRTVDVGTSAMILDVVCFSECSACSGCTDPQYLNFNPYATSDDGSCAGTYVYGCTYADADNYNVLANTDDGSCLFTTGNGCVGDLNDDGIVNTGDLTSLLSNFGVSCE